MIKAMKWNDAQQELKKTDVTYLIFGAEWCGDCVMMEPIVEELEKHFEKNEKVQFIRIDAEESLLFRDEKSNYKVLKIPTHVFMKNGEIITIKYEYMPLEEMIEEINKLF